MATKQQLVKRSSSSSPGSLLKEALLLPTRNAKLFLPVLLIVALPVLLTSFTNVLVLQPLAADVLRLANKLNTTDPSTPEFATIMEALAKDMREVVLVVIGLVVTTLVLAFVQQNIAFFATSTTYSGDRCSLAELLTKVIFKRNRFVGPSLTIALAGVLTGACFAVLAGLIYLVTARHSVVALVVFVLAFAAFLYLNVILVVAVAVSAADEGRRGVSAIRQAWGLMTRVRRKDACVLVVVVHLLPVFVTPLYAVALGYTYKSTAVALALLAVYALLSGVVLLFDFAAATVFYYQAMETKEGMLSTASYVKIPTAPEQTV